MAWGAAIGGLIGSLISADASRDNARAAQVAAQLQWDIANRAQAIEEELYDLWRQNYRQDELSLNNEIQALQPYRLQYGAAANRAIVEVRKQFGVARRKTLECMSPHCVGAAIATVRDMATGEALAAGWASTLMQRAEDAMQRSVDHQQRQEKLGIAMFAHKAYFNTDQTALAARIATGLQNAASQSASNQAAAAGYLVTKGLSTIFGEGGLLAGDKKNPAMAPAPVAAPSPAPAPAASITEPNQSAGGTVDPFTPIQSASMDIFTINDQA